tara:strand:+ start:506 stop:703 length:198 start_codon:yes stop_codon:yes gene_type:complete
MNSDVFKGNWKQIKGTIQQKWGKLTDDEMDQFAGKREELIGRIQERYGEERDKIARELDALLDKI